MWHRTQIEAFFLSKTLSLSLRLACATHSLVFRRNVLSDLFILDYFRFLCLKLCHGKPISEGPEA